MSAFALQSEFLERRRRELGMSRSQLANLSGLSLATVNRILRGGMMRASLANVVGVARALGVQVTLTPIGESYDFRQQAAKDKAQKIVGLVQGTSGLEAQAVDAQTAERMVNQTLHELMAGPRRKIWTPI